MEMHIVFFAGIGLGIILTIGYVARIFRNLYLDLIREHQAVIRDYQHVKENLFRDTD
jgi:hypothetical protein